MNHSEALQQMAAERYLLDELKPEEREAFEEHFFECPDCALDLRAGVAFVDEAKEQLPALGVNLPASAAAPVRVPAPRAKVNRWFSWGLPSFAVPAFAALLLVLGYQNLVTYPALRAQSEQPRILPWAPTHGATRGARMVITADRKHGVALPISLPDASGTSAFASCSFDLTDPQGKLVWTGSVPLSSDGADQRISIVIPGATLRSGSYTIAVSGIGPQGERTAIDTIAFEIRLTD